MRKSAALAILALALLAAAALFWAWRAQTAREEAERQLGLDSSRIVAQAFAATNQLKVSELTGRITSRASDPGMISMLDASQTMTAPFSVDYFVDLSKVSPTNFRWDAETRRLLIIAPDPAPARPNIDEGAAKITQSGVFISRGAALRMASKSTAALNARASDEAASPANMVKARDAARKALRQNALAPLRAAGVPIADVEVRFASEGAPNDDVWDYTTRIEDVPAKLEEMRRRTAP